MTEAARDYLQATRHPRACVLFVLPLLLIYEAGVLLLGADQAEALRNGADTWVRWLLAQIGLDHPFWPGLFIGIGLLAWAVCTREKQPGEIPSVCMGMVIESGLFAFSLWMLSCVLGRLLSVVNLPLAIESQPHPAFPHLISFLGAGIYEEVLFRLVLFGFLYHLFCIGELSSLSAISLAVIISALLFAAAHHIGAAGEPFDGPVFVFRTVAGVFFALLLRWRGLGIAVGAHAGYDVLVGVVLPSL